MSYRQFLPSPALAPYIDAYWTVTDKETAPVAEKIMPDGCVDIILNLGEEFQTDDLLMKNRHSYLVGTMTRYKEIVHPAGVHLVGIRFKPAAFPFFYNFSSLHEITDKTVEFDKRSTPEINEYSGDIKDQIIDLDRFFSDKLSLSYPKQSLSTIIADIKHIRGQITVDVLAKRHFISRRQLERHFRLYVGISPKEFINFIRYQSALERIRNNRAGNSLLDIAFECGYYDHAHLSNEIMKYTGAPPSSL